MRVAARRLDVDRHPAGLREARADVRPEPDVGLDPERGKRPPSEVDGRARERVVHRHDGVAVARYPPPVAERSVDRLADGERGVLCRVVLAGLDIAGALDDKIE